MLRDAAHQRQRLDRRGHHQLLPRAQTQPNLYGDLGQPVQLLVKRQIRKLRHVTAASVTLIDYP